MEQTFLCIQKVQYTEKEQKKQQTACFLECSVKENIPPLSALKYSCTRKLEDGMRILRRIIIQTNKAPA